MYLIFDTETTGLPRDYNAPISDTENWPRCIQIAWQLHDEWGNLIEHKDYLIKPDGFDIPYDSERIHGISTELASEKGVDLSFALNEFLAVLQKTKYVVGQNIDFDINVMGCELYRSEMDTGLTDMPKLDTCTEDTAELCQLPGGRGGKFKLPTLTELHQFLFGQGFHEAHNATADVEATTRCFLELMRQYDVFENDEGIDLEYLTKFRDSNSVPFQPVGLKHFNLKEESLLIKKRLEKEKGDESGGISTKEGLKQLEGVAYSHLHNHSQFSILQSTIQIGSLVNAAAAEKMPGVALTDSGNMMAAFHFVNAVLGHNKGVQARRKEAEEKGEEFEEMELTPIVGCEFFVCNDHKNKEYKDNGYQVVFLAKNKRGYHNLAKLASLAYIDGFYYVPRIDKDLILQFKEDLIVLSGNLYGEIPSKILNVGEAQAEEALIWWKEQFGEDFYLEIMRHGQEDEERANEVLLRFAEKHEVKIVATNNTYYIEKEDANAHDILLCVKDGELQSTPKGRGRGFRYGLENEEYYFKSQDEMKELFADLPEAIINIQEIVDKVEPFELARDVLLPKFDIPEEFLDPLDDEDGGKRGENAFLRHLTYVGAEKRYGEITDEIRERLDFELEIIAKTGYPGYFLIVQDFTTEARNMGVSVGPGRGSAAGSAVAYCIGITNVDPIAYDLLFERFLNPDRVSMPDIDIDFDDEGRQRVIDYVIEKYGSNQVAQIITYGTMAAKSSIRDTARVLDLPLYEADRIAKLVPDIKLKKLFGLPEEELQDKLNNEQMQMANELKSLANGNDIQAQTIQQAQILEGSVRNTGIHACGVIITPDDITNFVPVALAKDSDMCCTQFDNSVVESAGLLKMDFLGLKTLSLIKDAVAIVKDRHGIEIIPDEIPLDDEKTYELFQRGETVGIFQFESPGMQKHLKSLKPDKFGDLIAMNALYRPGPLEYIPNFIARKHGREEIQYDLPDMEEYLAETYGITVYQEQVMLLSQKLAGFTKGQADALRKAMGKKKIEILNQMFPLFIEGGGKNNHPEEILTKIWKDWEAFAAYAFNKSHSTCYSVVAFHTAYLKAHYPAEYMASVLSNNMNDIKSVTFFMEECKRMGLEVLGPDINESQYKFTVNKEGAIRFGLGAIKGVGVNPVNAIINGREEEGTYKTIFDFTKRIDLRSCNKKVFESLALAGAFDSFKKIHRAQYFADDGKGRMFLETAIKFGANFQENANSSQHSLFGGGNDEELTEPQPPKADKWSSLQKLGKEKEVVGIYISGHPLDDFKLEIDSFCTGTVSMLNNMEQYLNKELTIPGIVTEVEHRFTKKGQPFGTIEFEDYTDSHKLFLFGEDYLKLKHFMIQGAFLYFKGKVQRPMMYGKPMDKLEYKVNTIELLPEIRDKKTKAIRFNMSSHDVDIQLINQLENIFNQYNGSTQVKFTVYDEAEKIFVHMPSRVLKVNINNELLEEVDKLGVINYELIA
ncbi:MAG: DNA polymerase III subunit alpha [Crocinitomicaceae bacterium]|nr:DNA polymerase III subunit alpha [Crocinitomicaceae bacterium]